MTKDQIKYDLEDRTLDFARSVRLFVKKCPSNIISKPDLTQLIRSSGSIGANYIEANEALSKKDFYHRIKICRKESKETIYWLKLINVSSNRILITEKDKLLDECTQLMKIFGSIISKK